MGGDPEIRVMEELFDRKIDVYDVDANIHPTKIHVEGSLPSLNKEPIHISYHGKNHYNSVQPLVGKFPLGMVDTTILSLYRKNRDRFEFSSGFK